MKQNIEYNPGSSHQVTASAHDPYEKLIATGKVVVDGRGSYTSPSGVLLDKSDLEDLGFGAELDFTLGAARAERAEARVTREVAARRLGLTIPDLTHGVMSGGGFPR